MRASSSSTSLIATIPGRWCRSMLDLEPIDPSIIRNRLYLFLQRGQFLRLPEVPPTEGPGTPARGRLKKRPRDGTIESGRAGVRTIGPARTVAADGVWPGRARRRLKTWAPSAPSTSSRSASGRRARTPWGPGGRRSGSSRGAGQLGVFERIERVRVDLFGSLAKTGKGHGTDVAVMLGLVGDDPVTCDTAQIHPRVAAIRSAGQLALGAREPIRSEPADDLVFNTAISLPFHPNALTFTAMLEDGTTHAETYYSIGGGFVVQEGQDATGDGAGEPALPLPDRDGRRPAGPLPGPRPDDPRGRPAERARRRGATRRSTPGWSGSGRRCASASTAAAHTEGTLPGGPGRRPPGGAAQSHAARATPRPAMLRHGRRGLDRRHPRRGRRVRRGPQVGELLRPGGERGERVVRPGGHGADQRGGGGDPGRAAVSRLLPRGGRGGRRAVPAHGGGDRAGVQEGGDAVGGDGGLPGRDRRLAAPWRPRAWPSRWGARPSRC